MKSSSTNRIDPTGSICRQVDVQGLKRKLRESSQRQNLMSLNIYTLLDRMVANGDEGVLRRAILGESPPIHDFHDRLLIVTSAAATKKLQSRKFVPKDRSFAGKPPTPTPSPAGKRKTMAFPPAMYKGLSDDDASAHANTDDDDVQVLDTLRVAKKAKTFTPSDDEWIDDL